jgi:hypothetical protein
MRYRNARANRARLRPARLTVLAQASEETGVTVEELVQTAVEVFLDERRNR